MKSIETMAILNGRMLRYHGFGRAECNGQRSRTSHASASGVRAFNPSAVRRTLIRLMACLTAYDCARYANFIDYLGRRSLVLLSVGIGMDAGARR